MLFKALSLAFIFSTAALWPEQVKFSFHDPEFSSGKWKTHEGGYIQTQDFYLQAKEIEYHKSSDTHTLQASQHLLLIFKGQFFVADSFEYDFQKKRGSLKNGIVKQDLWYAKGKNIILSEEDQLSMQEAQLSSCPRQISEWGIQSRALNMVKEGVLSTQHLFIYVLKAPIFYLPYLSLNIKKVKGLPIRNRLHFRGARGTHLNFRYHFFSSEQWDTFLRLDYNLKGKAGLGLEADYHNDNTELSTKNFVSQDSFSSKEEKNIRFRLEGNFIQYLQQDKTSVALQFDRLSDENIILDQHDSFTPSQPEKTELRFHHVGPNWICNFYSRIRINPFETVKEELPSLEFNLRPFNLGNSGVFSSSYLKFSYLNFVFSETNASPQGSHAFLNDFSSMRTLFKQDLFKTFFFPYFSFSPALTSQGFSILIALPIKVS